MIVLIVWFISTLLFWLIGLLGNLAWLGWSLAVVWGLAMMFVFTAISHFAPMRKDLVAMVPKMFPFPEAIVAVTGVLELLGAIGLVLPATRVAAALSLGLLLLAMLPANIKAAQQQLTLRGKPATPLWIRIPMQILFLAGLGVAIWFI